MNQHSKSFGLGVVAVWSLMMWSTLALGTYQLMFVSCVLHVIFSGWQLSYVDQYRTKPLHAWTGDPHFPLVLFHNIEFYLTKARKLILLQLCANSISLKFWLKIWTSPYLSRQVYSWLCSPLDKHVSKFYSHTAFHLYISFHLTLWVACMPLESPSAYNMYLFNLRIANHILIIITKMG